MTPRGFHKLTADRTATLRQVQKGHIRWTERDTADAASMARFVSTAPEPLDLRAVKFLHREGYLTVPKGGTCEITDKGKEALTK